MFLRSFFVNLKECLNLNALPVPLLRQVCFFGSFSGGGHSKFGLAFSLKNHVFYEGVLQNLAFS